MRHAVYTGSKNLYGDMQTACKSLIANSDVDKVWLFVEDDDFDYYVPDMVETLNVSKQTYFPPGSANINTRFSYLSLMRAALALMPELADVDRILSLDVDTICLLNVSDIWDMPVDNCYFSASREDASCYKGMLYCNTGVAIYNLEKLRDGKAEEVVHALNDRRYENIEQDVFSFLCQGHIHDMPSEYNSTRFTDATNTVRIKHFAGYKAEWWRNDFDVQKYRSMSWDAVMKKHEEIVKKVRRG